MTLNALALQLIKSLDENQSDTGYITVVEQWVKDSLSEINIATRWHWARAATTFSTAATVSEYNLPSNLGEIQLLRLVSPRRIIEYVENPMYLAMRGWNFEQSGPPVYWWFSGDAISGGENLMKIKLSPVPDQIYSIERLGIYNIESLSSSDHIPLLTDMINVLKDRVRCYMLENDKDYDGADRAYQRFTKGVNDALKKLNTTIGNKSSIMKVTDVPSRSDNLARLDPDHF
jgi:hypothetical protein